jgi:general secretion pathway protein D
MEKKRERTLGAGILSGLALLVASCGGPERLPDDLSIEQSSAEVLKERLIAPIKTDATSEDEDSFRQLPRRQLIQVRYAPDSLQDQYFVSSLETLLHSTPQAETGDAADIIQDTVLSDAQIVDIQNRRAIERTEYLVSEGLELETMLLSLIRDLGLEIEAGLQNTVNGLGGTIPVFGRNLTGRDDSFLEVPNDLIFVGGENGTISSKTALLKQVLVNPDISFSVRNMPLSEALSFLFQTIGLQATISDSIVSLDTKVSLTVDATAISIMDALMEQHQLAFVYDPAIEVAQVYTQTEFDLRMLAVRQSIENYNAVLRQRQKLAAARNDYDRANEILRYVQLLLSGDDEGFMIGMESISRDPAGEKTSVMIADMTRAAVDLRSYITNFDIATMRQLSGKSGLAEIVDVTSLAHRSDLENILSEDPCIWPRQEIFTEKVAVYNAVIIDGGDASTGVVGKVKQFFDQTRPEDDDTAAASSSDAADDISRPALPSYCGAENPAPTVPIILPDDTGVTVIGTREDNDLVVRLIEQYDVPELQVLIEIFIITVSRDFSRQIDSMLLSASPGSGGSGTQEAVLSQVARAASTTVGSFNLDLNSPNNELGLLLNFLESNSLGRVVSSPTILVAAGQNAAIERDQIARVPGPNILDADNRSVAGPPVEYNAPFKLEINKVDINRLNNTVKLDVKLTDTRFNTTLALVDELSDRTSDVIDTTFWASPGDVVVLAGLTRNEESSATAGLPGTTGDLASITPLLGGADKMSTNLSETLIFMAPTVIDPSADNQPHSAFKR